ncbi:hypothetical protein WUBG_18127 [Wuchereria bancrofti]|uniref:Uncharacterized protein n=1 Tax=Wuchereria bancrofti TaxID=6293 RepID=J9DN88_WUCBA|nr:hypothetical protein WUBG_18127 [Wuchereria bancrofti]
MRSFSLSTYLCTINNKCHFTHTYIRTHTYIHTYTHTYINTHRDTDTSRRTNTVIYTCSATEKRVHRHRRTCSRRMRTYTKVHACSSAHVL